MKKIITAIAFIALTTVSAKAVDLGMFSVTAGLSQKQAVFGASGTEKEFAENGTTGVTETNKEHGVFLDDFSSGFIEVGVGEYLSIGYEMNTDPIRTPTNITNEGENNQNTLQVDFDDLATSYLKLNLPGGMYGKVGWTEVDITVTHTSAASTTYTKPGSTEGEVVGLGYQGHVKDTGFGYRIETLYHSFDNVKSNNGAATTANRNEVEVTNMEGVSASFSLTYTLGRNN
jgi:hypothetical protein